MHLAGRLQQQRLQRRVQVVADDQVGGRRQHLDVGRAEVAHQVGHALREGQLGEEGKRRW